MRTMIYKILTGCYIVAALVLVAACNDGLDIQTKYPFTVVLFRGCRYYRSVPVHRQ